MISAEEAQGAGREQFPLGAWLRRWTIRRRLIVVLAFLLGVGLLIADVVTYVELSSFLSSRIDAQLASARAPVERYIDGQLRRGQPVSMKELDDIENPNTYIEVLNFSGISPGVQSPTYPSGPADKPDPAPALPSFVPFSHPTKERTYDPRVQDANLSSLTVGAVGNQGFTYRVQVTPLPRGAALVVAAPLQPLGNTLSRLLEIEIAVSIVVLAVLAVVAFTLVRIGLRPLEGMAEQADAIASGELSRVTPSGSDTEVMRLGAALNAMLGEIERSFEASQVSETRMRRFVADVSHELRTPLTSIRGYAELFRRGAARRPQDVERAMVRIESEAARMSVLVDDLLLLARLDQGRPLEKARVDLSAIARDAAADAGVVDPDRPVSCEADDHVVILGDENRIRQVTSNLLSNALAHTPAGTPVSVRVLRRNGNAVLEVADSGPGISEDAVERVFDRFYRRRSDAVHGTAAGPEAGAGLGLSIVRAVALAHGGQAWVTSMPGEGSVFHVEVPAAPE